MAAPAHTMRGLGEDAEIRPMFKRFLMFGLLVSALVAPGCGASVDEEGKLFSDRVWFDQKGVAHCPHPDCMRTITLKPTDEQTDNSRVIPPDADHARPTTVCEKGHPVRWGADEVVCWACNGAGICPRCQGSGMSTKDKPCTGCIIVSGGDVKTGGGRCGECEGKGIIRCGDTVPRPY